MGACLRKHKTHGKEIQYIKTCNGEMFWYLNGVGCSLSTNSTGSNHHKSAQGQLNFKYQTPVTDAHRSVFEKKNAKLQNFIELQVVTFRIRINKKKGEKIIKPLIDYSSKINRGFGQVIRLSFSLLFGTKIYHTTNKSILYGSSHTVMASIENK